MTDSLDREEIIALLKRLGGDDDADVLAAARALHAAVAEAGTDWDALLVPENGGGADSADGTAGAPAETPAPADASKRDTEALALIDKLLGRSGVTDDFRRELEGYKSDIAEGEFADSDYKYLRALEKRLSGKG
jgi:hypothetical protein